MAIIKKKPKNKTKKKQKMCVSENMKKSETFWQEFKVVQGFPWQSSG